MLPLGSFGGPETPTTNRGLPEILLDLLAQLDTSASSLMEENT
jgi:hypothetical protein